MSWCLSEWLKLRRRLGWCLREGLSWEWVWDCLLWEVEIKNENGVLFVWGFKLENEDGMLFVLGVDTENYFGLVFV